MLHDLDFATWCIIGFMVTGTMAVSQFTDIIPQFSSREACIKRAWFFIVLSISSLVMFINVFVRIL